MNRIIILVLASFAALSGGCASITNPVADGIPVRRLPAEVLGRPKSDLKAIPLTALQQREPEPYLLDKGDVLAVIADNLIAPDSQVAPVKLPDASSNTSALGYPIPVNEDGTMSIPRLDPIPVKGLSVQEVEKLLRDYSTGAKGGKELLKPNQRISVQLLQKRRYTITVVREDSQPVPQQVGSAVFGGNRKGNGFSISLVAGENDVLRALNATGGPPGLDAKNEITVLRQVKANVVTDDAWSTALGDSAARRKMIQNGQVKAISIPLRLYPEQRLAHTEEDIILKDGDMVLIEARDTEVFYTTGLIGGGQFALPRDYDLDVIQAIAQVRGPLLNGGFTQNLFVPNAVGGGLGAPSPSMCTVLRKVNPTQQVPIRVDLNRAFIDPRERILILPGDVLVLQERPGESVGRYLSQALRLNGGFTPQQAGSAFLGGTANVP